jgi:hypothetical protein
MFGITRNYWMPIKMSNEEKELAEIVGLRHWNWKGRPNMDCGEILEALIAQIGWEAVGKIIVDKVCPSLFGWSGSDANHCGRYPYDCVGCWAKTLGLEEVEKS